jgi:hypothetical protein
MQYTNTIPENNTKGGSLKISQSSTTTANSNYKQQNVTSSADQTQSNTQQISTLRNQNKKHLTYVQTPEGTC